MGSHAILEEIADAARRISVIAATGTRGFTQRELYMNGDVYMSTGGSDDDWLSREQPYAFPASRWFWLTGRRVAV